MRAREARKLIENPLITPERWMADFEEAGFKEEVKNLIFKENAIRLLGLNEPME